MDHEVRRARRQPGGGERWHGHRSACDGQRTRPERNRRRGVDGAAVLCRAGVAEGLPFLLGADGSYDLQLNRFFRELDGWGVRAANSVLAYARDIMLFCRFLAQSRGGKSIWECDAADLRAFKRARLHAPGPAQVSVATWRRSIAALDKWAAWACTRA